MLHATAIMYHSHISSQIPYCLESDYTVKKVQLTAGDATMPPLATSLQSDMSVLHFTEQKWLKP